MHNIINNYNINYNNKYLYNYNNNNYLHNHTKQLFNMCYSVRP